MKGHVENQKKNQNQSVANIQKKENSSKATPDFEDNRSEAVVMRKLQTMANGAPPPPVQKKGNDSGLPDPLKSGVEALSGHSMDDVNVHYNSDKPSQLNAHAYAQGTDIHLASGQEQHLPHEAWHVVQQKQGRVKPTAQLKGKVNINDDAGLEKEADVMGTKALQMKANSESTFSSSTISNNSIAQLYSDSDLKKDAMNKFTEDESRVDKENSAKTIGQQELKERKDQNLGADEKIDVYGNLSLTGEVKGFFGYSTTFAKFMEMAEKFNNSKDIAEKQSLIKEMKPLAREWLSKKEIKEGNEKDADENNLLKQKTIYMFLRQTSSNCDVVESTFKKLDKNIESFKVDPIKNKDKFKQAVEEYKNYKSERETFINKFPPSVNLLYSEEIKKIEDFDKQIVVEIVNEVADVDTKLGFKATKSKLIFNIENATCTIQGKLELKIGSLGNADGEIIITLNESAGFQNIEFKNSNCEGKYNDFNIKLSNINYDFANSAITIEKANGGAKILDHDVELEVKNASILKGEFDYSEISGQVNDNIDLGLGVSVTKPYIRYEKNKLYELKGTLELTIPNSTAKGNVEVTLDNAKKLESVKIDDGEAKANFEGIELNLKGFSYADGTIKIKEASGKTDILGNSVEVIVKEAKLQKNSFDFEEITGKLPKVDYDLLSLEETELTISKKEKKFKGKTKYNFNPGKSIPGVDDINTSGEIDLAYSPSKKELDFKIDNGSLSFILAGQTASVKSYKYDSKDKSFKSQEASLDLNVTYFSKKFIAKDVSIDDKEGVNFKEISATADQELDLSVFKIKPKKYSIIKENSEYGLQADGAVSLSLPKFLGVKTSGSIEGGAKVLFSKPTDPQFEITSGEVQAAISNPLNDLGKLFGSNWTSKRFEVGAIIPVFPAISAIFGLYLQYEANLADEINATIGYKDNALSLKTDTSFKASAEGGVFGGVQGGSEILVALALLLNAGGKFESDSKVKYEKNYELGKVPEDKEFKPGAGFTYSLEGDVFAVASLDVVATALYFFQKRFKMELGKKSLGKFSFTNEKAESPKLEDADALAKREDLDKNIVEGRKEEAKKLTVEQLLTYDYTKRFEAEEKEEAIKLIKAAEEGRKTVHNEEKTTTNKNIFDNVPLANLQLYNQFVDNRCNWVGLENVFGSMQNIDSKNETQLYLKIVLDNMKLLGKYSNIAQLFVNHYHEKVNAFNTAYKQSYSSTVDNLSNQLLEKGGKLDAIEQFKKDFLHSKFWGDALKQESQIRTWSIIGESNYVQLANAYNELSKKIVGVTSLIDNVKKESKEVSFKLIQAHRKKFGGD